jgi:hypothetical protein
LQFPDGHRVLVQGLAQVGEFFVHIVQIGLGEQRFALPP